MYEKKKTIYTGKWLWWKRLLFSFYSAHLDTVYKSDSVQNGRTKRKTNEPMYNVKDVSAPESELVCIKITVDHNLCYTYIVSSPGSKFNSQECAIFMVEVAGLSSFFGNLKLEDTQPCQTN